jgi:hypothetical protein
VQKWETVSGGSYGTVHLLTVEIINATKLLNASSELG